MDRDDWAIVALVGCLIATFVVTELAALTPTFNP